jgi:hypothetical protein
MKLLGLSYRNSQSSHEKLLVFSLVHDRCGNGEVSDGLGGPSELSGDFGMHVLALARGDEVLSYRVRTMMR